MKANIKIASLGIAFVLLQGCATTNAPPPGAAAALNNSSRPVLPNDAYIFDSPTPAMVAEEQELQARGMSGGMHGGGGHGR